jgi:hypothetical protein
MQKILTGVMSAIAVSALAAVAEVFKRPMVAPDLVFEE